MKTPMEVELLKQLVALPTVSGRFSPNNQALDFIANFLQKRGMHITRKDYDGRGALIATVRPTKTPTVMLAAHVDVVNGPEELFTVRELEGKLYGRGVYDMKCAIAGYMTLVDSLQDQLDSYDFGIMITSDEETIAKGAGHLLRDGFRPKVAILPDGGAAGWQLESGTKGAYCLHITVRGKSAHGSRPWLGDSASLKLHTLLEEIRQLFPNPGPESNTLNVSAIHAGELGIVLNQIPHTADATLDIRAISADEDQRLRKAIFALCDKYNAERHIIVEFPAVTHDLTDPYLRTFAKSIEKVTGVQNTEGVISSATSEVIHFQEHRIPCAVTYPVGGGHHSDDEWVERASLLQFVPILLDYLQQVARIQRPRPISSHKPPLVRAN